MLSILRRKPGLQPGWGLGRRLLGCLGVLLLCVRCGGGSSGTLDTNTAPTARLESQAIEQVLALYRTALQHADVDRLADLLPASSTAAQAQALAAQTGASADAVARLVDAPTFLAERSRAFRSLTLTAVELQDIAVAADRRSATFLEIESAINPATLGQQTRLTRTTLQLTTALANGITTFLISSVQQTLLATVTTPGQIQAGALTRLAVTAPTLPSSVEITVPETGVRQTLTLRGDSVHGLFTPPTQPTPQPLQVRLQSAQGEILTFPHRYRLRVLGEPVVQRLDGTGTASFFAVVVAPDGTVWAGGLEPPRGGGTLYQVPSGTTTARLVGDLVADPSGRIEDFTFDRQGRLHTIVRATGSATFAADNRDVVLDQGLLCSTVNVFDPQQAYPLLVSDLLSGTRVPSPSTRVTAAGGGDVWLFGSDGGVARVADTFRQGACPTGGVAVRYDPVFRRESSGLVTNAVPAFVPAADGALWFGTALGLSRFRDGQFTPVLFNRQPVVTENVATLEQFFQAVAQAIFAARPLTTVAIGNVSFSQAFGRSLVKEDLIFSAVEDGQGRLWAGTLGGGVRRIEARSGLFQDTLQLTRAEVARITPETGARTVLSREGISSNIIFALALGPDGAIWAATDTGVSRIQESANAISVTNFSALDGLATPVRDVAVDPQGTAWLATDGGLFRLTPAGATLQGIVRDPAGRAVAAADVVVVGTPVRAVTDAAGRFTLTALPPGTQTLRVDSTLADGGPFTVALRVVQNTSPPAPIEVTVVPRAATVPVNPALGGVLTFPQAPGAQLDLAPQAVTFPPGIPAAVGLTPVPLPSLPLPLPTGFTAVAAVDLQPAGSTLTAPTRLTLPNTAQLAAGRFVTLLQLNTTTLQYEDVGRGRVSDDGASIATLSGGLSRLSAAVFATTAVTDAAQLVVLGGDAQSGLTGQLLPRPLTVGVLDGNRLGIAGVPVTFVVRLGDAALTTATVLSTAQGLAATGLQLGLQAGPIQVEATAVGLAPVRLSAVATRVPTATRLVVLDGDGQSGFTGQLLPLPLTVGVLDELGFGLAGIPVTFVVRLGDATLTTVTVLSTADGSAATGLRLGAQAGPIQVEATAPGLAPVRLTAVASRVPMATRLVVLGGDAQSAPTGQLLPLPLTVGVLDETGLGLAGIPVTFVVRLGDAAVTTVTVVSTAQGLAATGLQLGAQAGPIQVEAMAPGLASVSFTAVSVMTRPPVPRVPVDPAQGGSLTFPNLPGARLDIAPQALRLPVGVTPAVGLEPVALADLPQALPSGVSALAAVALQPAEASLTTPARLTLPNTTQLAPGRLVVLLRFDATVRQYTEIGRGRVSDDGASITTLTGGLSDAATVVVATSLITDAAQLVIVSGDGQSGTVGQPLPNPLVVAVRDGAGGGIAGLSLRFAIDNGAGTVTTVTMLSDAQGLAALPLTLRTQAGPTGVEVSSLGFPSVRFTVTGRGDRQSARLIEVSGNNQSGMPGVVLPEPLVVRLEDQFRNPLVGETLTGEILLGQAQFLPPLQPTLPTPLRSQPSALTQRSALGPQTTLVQQTDAQGQVSFRLQPDVTAQGAILVEIDTTLVVDPLQLKVNLGAIVGMVGYHIAVDTDGTLLVVDAMRASVRRINAVTGQSSTISGCRDDACTTVQGTGLGFVSPLGVAVFGPALVVADFFQGVLRVDPRTGDRTPLSGCADDDCNSIVGGGAPSVPAFQAVVVETSQALLAVDAALGLIRIDPTTGDRSTVSGCLDDQCLAMRGSGPPFVLDQAVPSRLVLADGAAVIADAGMKALVQVDLRTGDRTILSAATVGMGSGFVSLRGLAREATGTFVVTNQPPQTIVRVDPITGDRRILSGPLDGQTCPPSQSLAGSGPCFEFLEAIAVEPSGALVLVDASFGGGLVMRIDPVSGRRRAVAFLRR